MFNTKYSSNFNNVDLINIFKREKFMSELLEEDIDFIKDIILQNINNVKSNEDFNKYILNKGRKNKNLQSKPQILRAYYILLDRNLVPYNEEYLKYSAIKSTRGRSGVQVVTIFTSPVQFGKNDIEDIGFKGAGCPKNCYYCPLEVDENGKYTQPRSYLSTEPGNKRATANKHHPVGQMFDRIHQLEEIGHIPPLIKNTYNNLSSKLEIIISGGTFNFYPSDYIIWFVTCMYYSANIYYDYRKYILNGYTYEDMYNIRSMLSLEEEQRLNESSNLRIIGLTIETRPDYLNPLLIKEEEYRYMNNSIQNDMIEEDIEDIDEFSILRFFRKLGVTRVQIGVQHLDNEILKKNNRDCTSEDTKYAISLLKNNCFKVDIHLMLDMPFSTPEKDKQMLKTIFTSSNYQADQCKIYPTATTPYTTILKWYNEGKYIPYSEINEGAILSDVIIYGKSFVPEWVRINRVIRDIPVESIIGGNKSPDMRDKISHIMKEKNLTCKCIRCREIKLENIEGMNIKLFIRSYRSSNGTEYFISYESDDQSKLLAFIRLRINDNYNNTMPELKGYAFIRELHVLGHHTSINSSSSFNIQHRGYGKKLLDIVQNISEYNCCKGIAVISGVGVRDYYRKHGYELKGNNLYMYKDFSNLKQFIFSTRYILNKYTTYVFILILLMYTLMYLSLS